MHSPRGLDVDHPDRNLSGVLALLFARACEARNACLALPGHEFDRALPIRGGRDRQPVARGGDGSRRLRTGLDRAFRRGEEPAGDLSLSALVVDQRFSDVWRVAWRRAEARAGKGWGGVALDRKLILHALPDLEGFLKPVDFPHLPAALGARRRLGLQIEAPAIE